MTSKKNLKEKYANALDKIERLTLEYNLMKQDRDKVQNENHSLLRQATILRNENIDLKEKVKECQKQQS